MLVEIGKMWTFNSAVDFVKVFGLEKKFEEKYGVDIDEWEFEMSDDEVITELLEEEEGKYFVYYNEHTEQFEIFEII